jgi:hypothetical protein
MRSLSIAFSITCIVISILILNYRMDKVETKMQDLQRQNKVLIQFLNKDEIKFMLESFDSLDTQLTNHLELILENQYAIAKVQHQK